MSSSQESLISADEVMRRVRMRLGVGEIGTGGAASAVLTSVVAGTHSAAPNPAFKPPTADFKKRTEYVLADFLGYDDLAFVTHAYEAILHRAPDEHARSHLQALRSGAASKIEILAALRWSPEGHTNGVHIDGLLIPYKLHAWRRIPVLGWMLHWVHALVRLPRHARAVETHISAVSGDLQFFQGTISQVVAEQAARLESQEQALQRMPSTTQVDELGQRINVLAEQMAEQLATLQAMPRMTEELAALQAMPRFRLAPRPPVASTEATAATVDASAVDSDLDELYAAFEDQFRGPQAAIRERLQPYIKFITDVGAGTPSAPVLDLGCGRGEWLDMLREQGLHASGVDLNSLFVEECENRGLSVEYIDALSKLRTLPDASLGMVTLFHLAEHLSFRTLIDLFDEVRRVLVPGGGLIVETPNPENALVAQWAFYMDPTHRNPLPPQMLRWLVQARGFAQSDIKPLFEARGTSEVDFVADDIPGSATINALVKPLHASRDYAIMARKSVSEP